MKKQSQRDSRILLLPLALLFLQASARTVSSSSSSSNTKTNTDEIRHAQQNSKQRASRRSLLSQLADNDNREEQRDLIVGGKEADPGDFPYYVHLMKCGGSLISPRVVLTAAHCGQFVGDKAYVGAHEYGLATGDAVMRIVQDQLIHPDYDSTVYSNDFNLLLLNETVRIEDHTDIVLTLNTDDLLPADGQEVTVLGLGLLEENGEVPDYVRYVQVEKTADEYCNAAYDGTIEDSVQFCAGVEGGGKDACQGDSGGPLVVEYGDEHVQVGVVSSGTGCADPDYPGIYARVSGQMDWITEVVCDAWNQTDATFCPNYAAKMGRSVAKPRSEPPEWFRIQSKDVAESTPYCLSLENGFVATNGEAIVMLPCDGTYQQQWTQFDNDYLIRSKMNPNKCVSMDASSGGGDLELWDCFDKDHAIAFEAWSDGTIRLQDDASSQCWEYSSSESKTILVDCAADTTEVVSQQWKTTLRQEDLLRAKNAAKEALVESKEQQDPHHQEPKRHDSHKDIRESVSTSLETKTTQHKDIRDSSSTTTATTTTKQDSRGDDEDSTWFALKNVKTDTCLTLQGSTADLTMLTLEACQNINNPEQQWRFMEGGEIQTKLDDTKCVAPSGNGEMGDAMLVYECSGETMFGQWEIPAFDDAEDAIGPIVSKEDSSKCLSSHASDNVVVLGHCPDDEARIRNDRLWEIV